MKRSDPSSRLDLERAALQALEENSDGVGSWRLRDVLRQEGVDLSEATAGRLLRELDVRGLTVRVGNRGRTLTPDGVKRLRELEADHKVAEHSVAVNNALHALNIEELLDLLYVRRALERESARLAALRLTPDGAEALRESLKQQRLAHGGGWHEGWSFHDAISKASGNRLLTSLFDMVRAAAERGLGELSHILTEPDLDGSLHLVSEHEEILKAIESRDPEQAERMMLVHLDEVIRRLRESQSLPKLTDRSQPIDQASSLRR